MKIFNNYYDETEISTGYNVPYSQAFKEKKREG